MHALRALSPRQNNLRSTFDNLATSLGIKYQETWYTIKDTKLHRLLDNNLGNALQKAYPEYDWYVWLFPTCPYGFWQDNINRRQYLDWFAEQMDIELQEQWYGVGFQHIFDLYGGGLVKMFGGSVFKTLEQVYPEFNWLPWKHSHLTSHYWSDRKNQRLYFDWLAEELDIRDLDDWYRVSHSQVEAKHGRALLQLYDGLLSEALKSIYPEHNWLFWNFVDYSESGNQWPNAKYHTQFFDWLGEQLNIQQQSDWYGVDINTVKEHGGEGLLARYNHSSILSALRYSYPQFAWYSSKSSTKQLHADDSRISVLFNRISEELKIDTYEKWYQVKLSQIKNLLNSGYSTINVNTQKLFIHGLETAFPQYEWYPWIFPYVPHGYWNDRQNVRKYFDWLGDKLNIENHEGWYSVTIADVKEHYGDGMLYCCNNSLKKALARAYPEHKWLPWRFASVGPGYWRNHQNLEKYFDWLAEKLYIRDPSDWFKTSWTQIRQYRGMSVLYYRIFHNHVLKLNSNSMVFSTLDLLKKQQQQQHLQLQQQRDLEEQLELQLQWNSRGKHQDTLFRVIRDIYQ